MRPSDLLSRFQHDDRIRRLAGVFTGSQVPRARLRGLAGSAPAFILGALFRKMKRTQMVVLPDRESAAYFYNDLEQVLEDGSENAENRKVLFFPSSLYMH